MIAWFKQIALIWESHVSSSRYYRTFCSIPACAILSKLIEKESDKDGSTCWLLRGHRFPIKAPSAVPWTAQCSHRHWNVSDHQPISAPGSHLPPHHHRRGWVERMLQREESWILLLHLGGPWTPSSPRASWRVPQQLHLHSRRVIEPKVLLSERFSRLSMLHMPCKIMYFSDLFKKIMGYFLLAIQRWPANWVLIWGTRCYLKRGKIFSLNVASSFVWSILLGNCFIFFCLCSVSHFLVWDSTFSSMSSIDPPLFHVESNCNNACYPMCNYWPSWNTLLGRALDPVWVTLDSQANFTLLFVCSTLYLRPKIFEHFFSQNRLQPLQQLQLLQQQQLVRKSYLVRKLLLLQN